MGGLLIGHVDEQGRNVVVTGFFPEQTEASGGYCEFEGGFAAMAAGACDVANERCGGPHTPNLRVIGWIHTHPDIGIFLSGIDVRTFKNLRDMSSDGRCVAVVVDPLRKEHGVFRSPLAAQNKDAEKANGIVNLSEDLEARYHKFLDRMRFMQMKNGKDRLPFIIPGVLRRERIAMGDVDDIEDARAERCDSTQRLADKTQDDLSDVRVKFQRDMETQERSIRTAIESRIKDIKVALSRNENRLEREIKSTVSSIIEIDGALNDVTESNLRTVENILKLEDILKSHTESSKELYENVESRLKNIEKQLQNTPENGRVVLIPATKESKDEASVSESNEFDDEKAEISDEPVEKKENKIEDKSKKSTVEATSLNLLSS